MAEVTRPCVDCGEPIIRKSPKAQRCETCRVERRRALNREAVRKCHAAHKEQRAAYMAEWRARNPTYMSEWHQAKRIDPEYVERLRRASAATRERIKADDPDYFARWGRENPEAGRRARRARRARKMAAPTEKYTTAEIAERDGWRCQICGRRVDASLRYPAPESPSVDHIIPLSKGGSDLRANVQLAHLRCNISKHNRLLPQGEQLRLIG